MKSLRFPGQYEDAESRLYYNRFRYYDGRTGQYISADPIGLRGGINNYAYVPNSLKYIDPLGLCKEDATEYIDLYRAVRSDELAQILETNTFKNPLGIEMKYFTTSGSKASEYAKKAVLGFGDDPYTIVKSRINKRALDNPEYFAEVDGGIPSYVLPDDVIVNMKPTVLDHSPLP